MYSKSSLLQRTLIVTIALCCFAVATAQVPTISGFSPASGPVGTSVTISGTNFDNTPANNFVYFGTVKATVTTASANSLTVTVPKGSTHQRISVAVNGLTGQSLLPFATTIAGASLIPAYFSSVKSMYPDMEYKLPFVMHDLTNDGKPDVMGTGTVGQSINMVNKSTFGNILFDFPFYEPQAPGNVAPAIADWVIDGKPDVATLFHNANKLVIQRFATPTGNLVNTSGYAQFFTLAIPTALAAGDVDGDGKPDLAVSYSTNTNVSFLRNNSSFTSSTPSFDTRIDFPVGVSVNRLILADVDADGLSDLIVTNNSSGTLSIYRSTSTAGSISFAPKVDIAIGSSRSVVVTDLDINGYPEIVVCIGSSLNLLLYKNSSSAGNINFAAAVTVATPTYGEKIAIDDLDGDGLPDIAVSYGATNGVSILKNTSSANSFSFATGVTYPTSAPAGVLYVSDVDADGLPDLVITLNQRPFALHNNFNYAPVVTTFNPTQGKVGDTVTITGRFFTGATAVSFGGSPFALFTVVSDNMIKAVPGIGASGDIVVTTPYGSGSKSGFSYTMSPVITHVSPASGPVGSTVTLTGNYFNPVAANNIVNLGSIRATVLSATANSIDVVVPPGAPNQRFSVTTGNRTVYSPLVFHTTFAGAGPVFDNTYFDTTQQLLLPNPNFIGIYNMTHGDWDGDGKSDLVLGLANGTSGNQELYTLRNVSTGNNVLFSTPVFVPNGRPNSDRRMPVVDMNSDGKADLIITRNDFILGQGTTPEMAGIYKNIGTAGAINLNNVLNVQVTEFWTKFYTADFDGDGRQDLLVKSFYGNAISVYRNTTENDVVSFAPPISIGPANETSSGWELLLEDFDGDGRTDLAIGLPDSVVIYRNIAPVGSIAFAPRVKFRCSGRVYCCGDIDGDGKVDIASTKSSNNDISVLRNNSTSGNLNFDVFVSFPLTQGQTGSVLNIADFDGDGKPDIHINSVGPNRNAVLKNLSVNGSIAFATLVSYPSSSNYICIADWDNDGKPDIINANNEGNYSPNSKRTLTILRNTIGEPIRLLLCPPIGNGSITSNITGANYQWQVNTGSGFVNIANSANYNNVDGPVLQLSNIPSDWYGYQYRCVTNAGNSYPVVLRFSNTWTGTMGTDWENPANWSCGAVPDANTDVVINSGTVTINSNITVRSLKTNPTVTVTVVTGGTLTVLH